MPVWHLLFADSAFMEGWNMIVFDKLWITMEQKGVSTYWLREKCGIDRKTIRRLKANENMETKTLNKLCEALDCSLEDIAQYRKEESRG
jgi:DNA-binding Xre family transcriptional regulator